MDTKTLKMTFCVEALTHLGIARKSAWFCMTSFLSAIFLLIKNYDRREWVLMKQILSINQQISIKEWIIICYVHFANENSWFSKCKSKDKINGFFSSLNHYHPSNNTKTIKKCNDKKLNSCLNVYIFKSIENILCKEKLNFSKVFQKSTYRYEFNKDIFLEWLPNNWRNP